MGKLCADVLARQVASAPAAQRDYSSHSTKSLNPFGSFGAALAALGRAALGSSHSLWESSSSRVLAR